MSEDQINYELEQNISADAPKPGRMEDRLWEIFNLGKTAGLYVSYRTMSDAYRDEAAKLIKELCVMRSPAEVMEELERIEFHLRGIHKHDMRRPKWQGYRDALKWVLREQDQSE